MIPVSLIQIVWHAYIADVAPPNLPDKVINAADLLLLQRAVLGGIDLGMVTVGLLPPLINSVDPTKKNIDKKT